MFISIFCNSFKIHGDGLPCGSALGLALQYTAGHLKILKLIPKILCTLPYKKKKTLDFIIILLVLRCNYFEINILFIVDNELIYLYIFLCAIK